EPPRAAALEGAPAEARPFPRGADAFVVGLVLLALALLLAACAQAALRRRDQGERCRSNLRQIALGAIQYVDDKRFFPHVHKISELDGDARTNDAPRSLRALFHFDYLDAP